MNKIFISDLRENQMIDSPFLVQDKRVLETRNGKPYLRVRLQDKTGEIEGRGWEQANELARHFKTNDYARVRGMITQFQGELQITITAIHKLPEEKVRPEDFLPVSKKDIPKMAASLKTFIDTIQDADLKALLLAFIDDEAFFKDFQRSPAAKSMHHAWIGGLLEHSLSLCVHADAIARYYNKEGIPLNRDLLVTGAILHDIGKTKELTSAPSFEYTTEGKLLGHIVIGAGMVEEKTAAIKGFPADKLQQLKHLILSHHGEYAFGSPKLPMTLEAIALHFIDNLDAKINGVYTHLEKNTTDDSPWTAFHRIYGQTFYAPPGTQENHEEAR